MTEPTVEKVREALEYYDRTVRPPMPAVDLLAAAARLWVDAAEPNIEAMLRLLWEEFYSDMEGNPSDLDEAWEYNKEWSEVQMVGLPERLLVAAFGDHTLIRRADR